MRIVILGDIHLYDLAARPWQLLGKRLLGQSNLWLKRRHVFKPSLFTPVLEHALSLEPDWLVFTGDLTTTSLPTEFMMAADALGGVLKRGKVLIVPGNHDRYTFASARRKAFESFLQPAAPLEFPHAVDLSPRWKLIGLDSACPRLFSSRGRIDSEQLSRFKQMIAAMPAGQGMLLVCHYPMAIPPEYQQNWSHRLANAQALQEVLKQARGPVIYMHGHIHRPWQWQPMMMNNDAFYMINAGSPCMTSHEFPAGQGFWQLEMAAEEKVQATEASSVSLIAHRPAPGDADQSISWESTMVNQMNFKHKTPV